MTPAVPTEGEPAPEGSGEDGTATSDERPAEGEVAAGRRRRPRRATGGVAPTREVAATPSWDEVDREAGRDDDERITREVPPHW